MLNERGKLLIRLSRQLYFTIDDLVDILQVSSASAKVFASRWCQRGLFIRLKKGLYTLAQNWQSYSTTDFFQIANILQVPSYVSLTTAMSFHGITTQVQSGFIESCARKRSVRMEIQGVGFGYFKLKKELYFGFVRKDNFFIASGEKALVDAVYLHTFGKYRLDLAALDISGLDRQEVRRIVKIYPLKTRQLLEKLCGI